MRRVVLLPLLALALLAGVGQALPQTKVRHPDGELPTALVTYPRSAQALVVWVAYEGFRPYVLPDLKSERLTPAAPLRFMQPLYVASTRNEQGFHLLVTSDDGKTVKEYVGWVPGRYLVRSSSAEIDPDTGIVRKVLVVNTRDSLGTRLDELMIRHAPLPAAPGRDEPQRLLTTMFVFGEADDYVLVGDAASFNPRRDEDALKVVQGWLPRHRVAIWNTREAVEWDYESTLEPKDRPHYLLEAPRPKGPPRRTTPGRIYASVEKAKLALKAKGGAVEGLFEEEEFRPDGALGYPVGAKLGLTDPRFPVMRPAVPGARHPRAGDLYEVGGIGGLYDGKGRRLLSGQQVKRLQDVLDSLKEQRTQTDVLFVVDDTESMDRWFPVVAKVVRRITDLAREGTGRNVRVAVAFYNDTFGKRPDKEVVKTRPLEEAVKGGAALAAEVAKHKCSDGGDMHEMVFRGILEAHKAAGFRARARKLLVVIGDCGDISAVPGRMKADPGYAKKYNVKAIVDRLVPEDLDYRTPVEFYAIQVVKPGLDRATSDFKDQMEEIVKQYGARLRERRREQLGADFDEKAFRAPAEYFDPTANRGTSVEAAMNAQYARILREARDLEEKLNRVKQGKWVRTKLTPETEREINRELARRGLKVRVDDLRRSGGLQLFQTGYVWERTREGLPQVRKRVFLNDGELRGLVRFLGHLDTREGADTPLPELLAKVIEAQANTGDRNDPERLKRLSLRDLTRQSMGLAFRNSLMGLSHEALRSGKADLQDSEYFALLHSRDLLQDALDERAYDYTVRIRPRGKVREYVRTGKGRPAPRRFHIGNDTAVGWYYLDYDKEWP